MIKKLRLLIWRFLGLAVIIGLLTTLSVTAVGLTPNQKKKIPALKLGEKGYVPISVLRPAQVRYSNKMVREKIKQFQGLWYDDGRSIFELNSVNTIPVVLGPKGCYYLLDGHHSVLASIRLRAKTMPVEVKVDLSYFPKDNADFWAEMVNKQYARLLDRDGSGAKPPRRFSDLKADLF